MAGAAPTQEGGGSSCVLVWRVWRLRRARRSGTAGLPDHQCPPQPALWDLTPGPGRPHSVPFAITTGRWRRNGTYGKGGIGHSSYSHIEA